MSKIISIRLENEKVEYLKTLSNLPVSTMLKNLLYYFLELDNETQKDILKKLFIKG